MNGITQEVTPIQVVNVNGVSIEPARRPRVNHVEPKTAVLKSSPAVSELGTVHVKGVAAAETCTELGFGNAPMPAGLLGYPAGQLMLCRLLLLRRLRPLLVLS